MVVFVNFFFPHFSLCIIHTHTHTYNTHTPLLIMQSGSFKDTRNICTLTLLHKWAFQVALVVKNPLQVKHSFQCRRHKRHRFDPWVGKISQSRKWHPTPAFLLGLPWTEEPVGWQSTGSQRIRHNWVTEHTYCTERPSFEFYDGTWRKVSLCQNLKIKA